MLPAVSGPRLKGHLAVEERKSGRVWVAEISFGRADRTRKVLGPAWVRASGKTTARGAKVWRAADGSKPDATYLTPSEAEEKLSALIEQRRAQYGTGRTRAPGKTWQDAAGAWLDEARKNRGAEETTLRGYQSALNALRRAGLADDRPLKAITPKFVETIQDDLLERLSRKTVSEDMRILKAVLTLAEKKGWVARAATRDVTVVPVPKPDADFRVLEPTELETVARAILVIEDEEVPRYRGPRGAQGRIAEPAVRIMRERRFIHAEAVRLLAYTGLRIGELRVLRYRDIDFSGETIRVPRSLPTNARRGAQPKAPKSGRPRSLPLIEQAIGALDRLEKAGYSTGPEDLVLASRADGPLSAGPVRKSFYRGLERAGFAHMRDDPNPMVLHDLRHTFGTIAVRAFPLSDVQEWLGHADIQTTMRYVHHVPRADAARKLSAAFSQDLGAVPAPRPTELAS